MSSLRGSLRFIELTSLTSIGGALDLSKMAYPSGDQRRIDEILLELRRNKVSHIALTEAGANYTPVLIGKGVRGMVFLGLLDNQPVALKILRTDSPAKNMHHEAKCLLKANELGVGPTLYSWSPNIIVMEYIKGENFDSFLATEDVKAVENVLEQVFQQAYILDQAHLDHGQLTNASDHVIIRTDSKPVIIDFSCSSQIRKPKNVTALSSYLQRTLFPDQLKDQELLTKLKRYKISPSVETFSELMDVFKNRLRKR